MKIELSLYKGMLQQIKDYVEKEENSRPRGSMPKPEIVIFLGTKIQAMAKDLLHEFDKHWTEAERKSKLRVFYLASVAGQAYGNYPYCVLECTEPNEKRKIEFCGDAKELNRLFRNVARDQDFIIEGYSIRLTVLTSPEDPDAQLTDIVLATAREHMESTYHFRRSPETYIIAFASQFCDSRLEEHCRAAFFDRSMRWGKADNLTKKIFCEYDSDEPREVETNFNGLLLLDAIDSSGYSADMNQKRTQIAADVLDIADLFRIHQKYLWTIGEKNTESYAYRLASALQRENWVYEKQTNHWIVSFNPLNYMKKQMEYLRDGLEDLFQNAVFAVAEEYYFCGMESGVATDIHGLEEKYFGTVLEDLFTQWAANQMKQPVPADISACIGEAETEEELNQLESKLEKIAEDEPEQELLAEKVYPIYLPEKMTPWELRERLIDAYANCLGTLKQSIFSKWAKNSLKRLDERRAQLREEVQLQSLFYEKCQDALRELQSISNSNTIMDIKDDEKIRMRELVLHFMKNKIDSEELFRLADSCIRETDSVQFMYYFRDMMADMQKTNYTIDNGIHRGKEISICEPETTARLLFVRLISFMDNY